MLPRFLADSLDAAARHAQLGEDETAHLTRVLRLGPGDEIAVFDGHGREYRARVKHVLKGRAELSLVEELSATPEAAVRLTLAQAALKGDKMDDVVRDATMMGVAAIEPLITEHSIAPLKEGRAPNRWRRIAIASVKQCRRAVVPAIGPGRTLDDWIARDRADLKLMLAEPALQADATSTSSLGSSPPRSASLLVGPEGGWSAAEVARATAAGYQAITLGRRTLRADAVAIIAIGVLQFVWGDL
jgi:16S rRNA (uracil1498-N3)-methyltransferase